MTQQLKVLHLTNTSQRRGAERFALRLIKELDSLGIENTLSILHRSSNDTAARDEIPPDSIWLNGGQGPLSSPAGLNPLVLLRLARTISRLDPHVILGHGSSTLKYIAATKLPFSKRKTVYLNIGIASDWAVGWKRRNLNKFFLRNIDHVISVSDYTADDFRTHYKFSSERISVIPNGVASAEFTNLADDGQSVRVKYGIGKDEILLLSVGNLSAEKGQEDLLRCAAGISSSGVKVHVMLTGTGPLESKLRSLANSLDIAESVHFTGSLPHVSAVLDAADIFVLPSKTEGMPAVLIEAGMAGLPAVSYDVGAVSEVIEDGESGLIVPSGDIEAMQEAISRLIGSEETRRRMGEKAREICMERFEMRHVAEQFAVLLKDIATSPEAHANPG